MSRANGRRGQDAPTGMPVEQPWAAPRTFRLGGSLVVSLWAAKTPHDVSRALQGLERAPSGAAVTVVVPATLRPDDLACRYLADHARHLGMVTIESADADTIRRWHDALERAQAESAEDEARRRNGGGR